MTRTLLQHKHLTNLLEGRKEKKLSNSNSPMNNPAIRIGINNNIFVHFSASQISTQHGFFKHIGTGILF